MDTSMKVAIIRQVAIDYHSGMGSRGYRLSSACYRWLKRRDVGRVVYRNTPDSPETAFYNMMASRYGGKM
jgi:hypothetical protein